MLPDQVNDARAAMALLHVRERERRHLRPAEPAAKENRKNGMVTQPAHVIASGALSNACACRSESQFPVSDTRQALTVALVKPGRGACWNQAMNSSKAMF
jgi:hypothetical protein